MAKFNITVDIDYIDEEGNLDEELYNRIVNSVVEKVSSKVSEKVITDAEEQITKQIDTIRDQISQKLNSLMEEFFEQPRNMYDKYGDLIKSNTSVKDLLKQECDTFLNCKVNTNGNPDAYSKRTRAEYLVNKVCGYELESAIKKATEKLTKEVNTKVQEMVKFQLGDKIGGLIGIDDILKGERK